MEKKADIIAKKDAYYKEKKQLIDRENEKRRINKPIPSKNQNRQTVNLVKGNRDYRYIHGDTTEKEKEQEIGGVSN